MLCITYKRPLFLQINGKITSTEIEDRYQKKSKQRKHFL